MPQPRRRLHDAMEIVLATQPDRTATISFISHEIERLRLWTRPNNGRFPEASQIRLHALKPACAQLFEMPNDVTVRLVKRLPTPTVSPGVLPPNDLLQRMPSRAAPIEEEPEELPAED